jgi:hypothetical protein
MGLNQLYFEHQLAVIRAAKSDILDRPCFERTARKTAAQIGQLQRSLGAPAAAGWERFASTQSRVQAAARTDPSAQINAQAFDQTSPGNLVAPPAVQARLHHV